MREKRLHLSGIPEKLQHCRQNNEIPVPGAQRNTEHLIPRIRGAVFRHLPLFLGADQPPKPLGIQFPKQNQPAKRIKSRGDKAAKAGEGPERGKSTPKLVQADPELKKHILEVPHLPPVPTIQGITKLGPTLGGSEIDGRV